MIWGLRWGISYQGHLAPAPRNLSAALYPQQLQEQKQKRLFKHTLQAGVLSRTSDMARRLELAALFV